LGYNINGMIKKCCQRVKDISSKVFSLVTRAFYAVLYFLFYIPCGGKRAFRKKFFNFINLQPGDRILDLCCGPGQVAAEILKCTLDIELVGVDISGDAIRTARNKNQHARAVFIQCNVTELPFEGPEFTKCIFSFGIHHLTEVDRQRSLNEIHRVLKPEGLLYIVEYNSPESGLQRLNALVFAWLDQSGEAYKMVKQKSLAAELERGGFIIKDRLVTCGGAIQLIRAQKRTTLEEFA